MTAGPAAAREVTRVLVLDDVAENLRLMGELLAASPVEVSLAKSGQQALRLAARVPFQLAILDLNLPDIDGFEVARQMRELQPDCGLIYCSAYNDRTRRDRAFAEGALDFIEKPLEIGSARQRLATHLERLALREGLKTERERLAKVVASIPDAVVSLDREQRVVTWNPAAERVFGVPAADALGSRFDRFVPQAAAAAAPGTVQETMGRRGDGTPIHLELGASPWVQGGEAFETFIVRDVTERAMLLEQLRHAKEAAEQSNAAKSAFLATMSHEIRTPMNAVIGMTHLAQRHAPEPRAQEYLRRIHHSAQHLMRIIDDILDFSKIEAGKVTLERVDFTLAGLIETFTGFVAEKAASKGLALHVDIAPDVPVHLVGDPLRLGQILINYGHNAVKFTDHGEIRVAVSAVERGAGEVTLRFTVTDTGIGLTEAQQARLFQSFQQADESTTRQYGGTGLGLAIARRLAELMGGEVGVSSRPGEGSTFWFTARVGIAAAVPRGAGTEAGPAGHAALQGRIDGSRVLVVDDNEVNVIIAREMLLAAGAQVETAGDGAQAVQRVQGEAFDLVLMDMQMPVMDGLQATREIRSLPGRPRVPIVAMTANALESDRLLCLAAGMDDVLVKPFEPEGLLAIAGRWMAPRQAPT